jgi:Fis family transcriptional regulator, factor for inversion stimulation protein
MSGQSQAPISEVSRYEMAVNQFRAYIISEAIEAEHGNLCAAARRLGIHRNTVNRAVKELNIAVKT